MADEIIDLTPYLRREEERAAPAQTMALWGAEGERSRLALPLWRLVYLVQAERCVIASRCAGEKPEPFVVLDLSHDPARLEMPADLPGVDDGVAPPELVDLVRSGMVVYLGERVDRSWYLIADGGSRGDPLLPAVREDVLFLAGECAGLLFLRDLADEAEE